MTDKQNMVYSDDGTLCSRKRKEILTHATTWMNLDGIRLSGNKIVAKRQILYNSTCMGA
jgi:hypothetical protein